MLKEIFEEDKIFAKHNVESKQLKEESEKVRKEESEKLRYEESEKLRKGVSEKLRNENKQ